MNMKNLSPRTTHVSDKMMAAAHYPGGSKPRMGPGDVGKHMPRQRTKKGAAGWKPNYARTYPAYTNR